VGVFGEEGLQRRGYGAGGLFGFRGGCSGRWGQLHEGVLPALCDAEVIDVGYVVAAVPAVGEGGQLDGRGAAFGVAVAALPLVVGEGLEEHDPAGVEALEELEGPLDGGCCVAQRGPGGLVVGLDGRPVLGEGEAYSDEGVHVAVGDVVDELPDSPAAFAVGRVEVGVLQAFDSVAQFGWEIGQSSDGAEQLIFGDLFGRGELADGIARVEIGHGVETVTLSFRL
jgi:hypothetical protein